MFPQTQILAILLALVLVIVGCLIAASSLQSVIYTYVPIPFFDEWDMIVNWARIQHEAGSVFVTLFDQHNEHRLAIPRLLFIADFTLLDGKGILNLLGVWVVQALHALVLWWLIVRALSMTRWARVATAGVLLALMFSAMQLDNLGVGFQVQFVGVFFFATLFIWCLLSRDRSRRRTDGRLLVGILLAMAAAFTMANGLLTWIVGLLIGLRERWSWRNLALFALAAVATFWFYFADFYFSHAQRAIHWNPLDMLQFPWPLFQHTALYLGHALSPKDYSLAIALGGIGSVTALGLMAVFLFDSNETYFTSLAAKTLTVVTIFILGTAILTSLGRIGFGVAQATAGRYVTPAIIFWIGLAASLASLRPPNPVLAGLLRYGAVFVVATSLLVVLSHQAGNLKANAHWRNTRMAAVSALLADVYDQQSLLTLYPDPYQVAKYNEVLADRKLSFHSLNWAALPGKNLTTDFDLPLSPHCHGYLDQVQLVESDKNGYQLRGWVVDRTTNKAADIVVLTTEDHSVVGIAFAGRPRTDIRQHYPNAINSGWFGHAKVKPGQTIKAYALVNDNRSVCLLRENFYRADE
jgi:hypothetical protein